MNSFKLELNKSVFRKPGVFFFVTAAAAAQFKSFKRVDASAESSSDEVGSSHRLMEEWSSSSPVAFSHCREFTQEFC